MDLEKLKSQYKKLQEKYNLPEFKEINDAFEIDRIERETDRLLREIRKTMLEKIVGYIRLIELIISPAQASPVFMILVKEVSSNDKLILDNVIKEFAILELNSFKLDIESTEDEEAKEIKNIITAWEKTKEDLKSIIKMMERNWKSTNQKRDRNYFS